MSNSMFKTCPSCGESVQQDFDFCPFCSFYFPKSFWQTHKNTIAITSLATTVVFLGSWLLFGPSKNVQTGQSLPKPVPSIVAAATPTASPTIQPAGTPKPLPSSTAIQSKTPTPPPAPKATPEVDLQIKGNRNSGIYHLPGCMSYNSISPRNVVWFKTEEEAEAAGYRKARNCN